MATFVISNLDLDSANKEFEFENIEFLRLTKGIQIEDQWRDEQGATFKAVADDNLNVTPIIQDNGLIGVVDDLCLLLSLAQSRIIFCCLYEIGGNSRQRVSYKKGKIFDPKTIEDSNLKAYLLSAANTIRQPNWAKKTGFIPSAYFWAETFNHEPGDIGFLLTWIALEILANAHTLRRYSKNKADKICIRQKISEMVEDYHWQFLREDLISKSKKIRDKIMHEGNYGNIDRNAMPTLFSKLLKAVQLALINLLGCSSYINNNQNLTLETGQE
jgi:hypothetical protein